MKTGINFIVRFLKDWTLPCAMLAGVTSYLCFSRIEEFFVLKPYLYALSSFLTPVLIFMMLFFTFCKVNPRDLRPRLWHFWLLALQVLACVGAALWIVKSGMSGESLLIWEGTLACLLCPTATAAAVITGKLGGNSGSLTTYTLESNILSAILITLICPWVHPHADLSWTAALFVILSKVTYLLICPFLAALLVRYLLPSLHVRLVALKDVAFYLWAVSLAMVMAQTTHIVLTSSARPLLCGGSLTGCALSMSCLLSKIRNSTARAAFSIMASGSGKSRPPHNRGCGWPSWRPWGKSPPTSRRSCGSWRSPALR